MTTGLQPSQQFSMKYQEEFGEIGLEHKGRCGEVPWLVVLATQRIVSRNKQGPHSIQVFCFGVAGRVMPVEQLPKVVDAMGHRVSENDWGRVVQAKVTEPSFVDPEGERMRG